MQYQQSFAIERRLEEMLALIRSGRHSTPSLAESLGISVPTVSRCLTALRDRGYDIKPVRGNDGWHYVLTAEDVSVARPVGQANFRGVDAST